MNKLIRKIAVGVAGILLIFGVKKINISAQTLPSRYPVPEQTRQLIVVRPGKKGRASFGYFEKNSGDDRWKKKISCSAWIGSRGLGKQKEGDKKTPTGFYPLGRAFGICRNPGTKMRYTRVKQRHYWCSDSDAACYNQMIVQGKNGHRCQGEHLIRYKGAYDYAVAIGYNPKGKPGKGSALFLHCSTGNPTAGCVAIPKKQMKKVLKRLRPEKKPGILLY